MKPAEIVTRLASFTDLSEGIYAVNMRDILAAIASRMGEEALTLSAKDLQLAREEVEEAINIIWTSVSMLSWDWMSGTSPANCRTV
ncbi:MAG: hypothetical protein ACYDHC_02870 [Desulfuromonadaceae bacterium]